MVKLSIIVPIFNVEQFIRKCVDSLITQDYDNYEIILVDDGSTDGSGAICDEYASLSFVNSLTRSVVINVIHLKNGGLSAARNAGVKVAKGEYVMFVDSDDYIEPNVLGGLMEQIERDRLDVLRFKFQNVRLVRNEGVKKTIEQEQDKNKLTSERYEVFQPYKRDRRLENDYSEEVTDGVSFLNTRMNTQCYAVMFVIKRSLIYNEGMSHADALNKPYPLNEACLFTEGIYFEDTDWTPRMLCRAKRVASNDTIVYNYLMREGSITNAVNRSKQRKVLNDKMRLVGEMQRQAADLKQKGLSNGWFKEMIADTVVSVIGILSVDFYNEKDSYLDQLKSLKIYPIENRSSKTRLINLSPRIAVWLLHLKNA